MTPSDHPAPPAAPKGTRAAKRLAASWVPIRSLGRRHHPKIAQHLRALEPHDRYLRFGYAANDAQIEAYVASLDFERDEVFGIFNRRLDLIALAHLAYSPQPQLPGRPAMVEFGVSVLRKARGRGYGRHLFDHAVLHARNRGIDTLFIHALSENTAMLKIARSSGARIERDGSESQAWLKLPPGSIASHIDEMLGRQASEMNHRIKRQVHALDQWLDVLEEVKASIANPASE